MEGQDKDNEVFTSECGSLSAQGEMMLNRGVQEERRWLHHDR